MTLYILMLLFYLICMWIELQNKRLTKKRIWIIFLIIPLFILVGFRGIDIGNDTGNYYRIYNTISKESILSNIDYRMESGYIIIMRFFGFLGCNYLTFQLIVSFFIYFSLGKFLYKYSENIAFSILVFICLRFMFFTMNIVRQCIAISILFYSVKYIEKKELLKFISIVILASTFHNSAIIFILFYCFSYIRFSLRKATIFSLIFIILGTLASPIVNIFFEGRYIGYFDSQYSDMDGNVAVYLQLLSYILFVLLAYFTNYYKEIGHIKKNFVMRISFTASMLAMYLGFISLNLALLDRLIAYFSVYYIIYLPSLLKYLKRNKIILLIGYCIFIYLFLYFYIITKYRQSWNHVIPYHFFSE